MFKLVFTNLLCSKSNIVEDVYSIWDTPFLI